MLHIIHKYALHNTKPISDVYFDMQNSKLQIQITHTRDVI
jgi:hypothetical protein